MNVSKPKAFEVVFWQGMWKKVYDKKSFICGFGDEFEDVEVSQNHPAITGAAWARDGSHYYSGPAPVVDADYASFSITNSYDAKDKDREYHGAFDVITWPKRRRDILGIND